jgi:hypothetical protein
VSQLGWLGAGIARGRFGGVVGKVTLMFGVVATMAALALWSVGENSTAAIVAGGVVVIAAVVALAVLMFAHHHPDLALLEGAEWLQYQGMIQSKNAAPTLPGQPQEDVMLLPPSRPVSSLPAAADEEVEDGE